MKQFILHSDGASRGNPGPAAAGIVIQTPDGVIWTEEGIYLGVLTNNEAEYKAVILVFSKLLSDFNKHLPTKVELMADSQLIINQLSGKYKIKNENLRLLYKEVKILEKNLGEVKYTYIPREQNFLADKLANLALDRQEANE